MNALKSPPLSGLMDARSFVYLVAAAKNDEQTLWQNRKRQFVTKLTAFW